MFSILFSMLFSFFTTTIVGSTCWLTISDMTARIRVERSRVAAQYLAEGYVPFALRYEPVYHGLVLDLVVSGRVVPMLLDTGSSVTVVDTSVARALKLPLGRVVTFPGIVKDDWQLRSATLPNAAMSRLCQASLPVQVGDLNGRITAKAKSETLLQLGGLLGSNIISQLAATVDFQDRILWVKNSSARDLYLMQGRWQAVGLISEGVKVVDPNYLILFTVNVQGDRVKYCQIRYDVKPPREHHHKYKIIVNADRKPKVYNGVDVYVDGIRVPKSKSLKTGLYTIAGDQFEELASVGTKGRVGEPLPTRLVSTPENSYALFSWARLPSHMDRSRYLSDLFLVLAAHHAASWCIGTDCPQDWVVKLPGCEMTIAPNGRAFVQNTAGNLRIDLAWNKSPQLQVVVKPAK